MGCIPGSKHCLRQITLFHQVEKAVALRAIPGTIDFWIFLRFLFFPMLLIIILVIMFLTEIWLELCQETFLLRLWLWSCLRYLLGDAALGRRLLLNHTFAFRSRLLHHMHLIILILITIIIDIIFRNFFNLLLLWG